MKPEEQRLLLRQIQTALSAYCDKVRFTHASELARAGRLHEAQVLLLAKGREPSIPSELDLLARIAAQQGNLAKAKVLWQNALQADPHCEAYRKGLMEIAVIERFHDLISPVANLKRLFLLLKKAASILAASMRCLWRVLQSLRRTKKPMSESPTAEPQKTALLAPLNPSDAKVDTKE